jgi:hypothetical protein
LDARPDAGNENSLQEVADREYLPYMLAHMREIADIALSDLDEQK